MLTYWCERSQVQTAARACPRPSATRTVISGFLLTIRRRPAAAGDHGDVVDPERYPSWIEIVDPCVADRANDPAEVRVGSEEGGLHQRRMRDGARDAVAFGDVAPALDEDRDELGRAFAVADDRLRELDGDRGDDRFHRGQPRVVRALDRRERRAVRSE